MSHSRYLQVIAHYFTKPGSETAVGELLKQLAQETRKEAANLYYEYFQSVSDPTHYVILEKYTEPEALETHRQTTHFQEIGVGQIIPLLSDRRVESYFVDNT